VRLHEPDHHVLAALGPPATLAEHRGVPGVVRGRRTRLEPLRAGELLPDQRAADDAAVPLDEGAARGRTSHDLREPGEGQRPDQPEQDGEQEEYAYGGAELAAEPPADRSDTHT
jgi:hypothetical protein